MFLKNIKICLISAVYCMDFSNYKIIIANSFWLISFFVIQFNHQLDCFLLLSQNIEKYFGVNGGDSYEIWNQFISYINS